MSIMTVTGPIDAGSLGTTLSHEHIFIDIRNQFREFDDPEKRRISRQKVCIANLGAIRRNPYAIKDNLFLDDMELAVEELLFFKKMGGATVVDCTSIGINREAGKLRDVALRTGLHIIAGTGYYTHDTHSADMPARQAGEIADEIIRDMTEGIDGTGIKAGIIGEIGTGAPIHADEKKNLQAAAIAFRQVRTAVYVHTYPWGKFGLEAVDILLSGGVDPGKIVVCHIDVEFDEDYIRALLERGVYAEFDDFGKEFYIDCADRGFARGVFARDIERVRFIKRLLELGYERQILITNDICLKSMLHRYGGWGYDHILRNVKTMMLDEGIPYGIIDVFLCENTRKLLDG